jgi:hypothetical protein
MLELGSDFSERCENELTFEHARVRNLQLWRVDGFVAEKKDVDVEEARAFGKGFLAAEPRFDCAKGVQELNRLGIGFALNNTIKEPGLVEVVDGLGFVDG